MNNDYKLQWKLRGSPTPKEPANFGMPLPDSKTARKAVCFQNEMQKIQVYPLTNCWEQFEKLADASKWLEAYCFLDYILGDVPNEELYSKAKEAFFDHVPDLNSDISLTPNQYQSETLSNMFCSISYYGRSRRKGEDDLQKYPIDKDFFKFALDILKFSFPWSPAVVRVLLIDLLFYSVDDLSENQKFKLGSTIIQELDWLDEFEPTICDFGDFFSKFSDSKFEEILKTNWGDFKNPRDISTAATYLINSLVYHGGMGHAEVDEKLKILRKFQEEATKRFYRA